MDVLTGRTLPVKERTVEYRKGMWQAQKHLECFAGHPKNRFKLPYNVAAGRKLKIESTRANESTRAIKDISDDIEAIQRRITRAGDDGSVGHAGVALLKIDVARMSKMRDEHRARIKDPCISCPANVMCDTLSMACRKMASFQDHVYYRGPESLIPSHAIGADLMVE